MNSTLELESAGQLSPKHLAEVEWDTLKNHSVLALGIVF
jgi:hypothetical protein